MSSSSDRKSAGGLNDSDETIRSYIYVRRMVAELPVLEEVGVPLKILRKVAMESQLYRRGSRVTAQCWDRREDNQ